MAVRATTNTISKGISGGVTGPMKSGPNRIITTIIKNIRMEPRSHSPG